MDAAKICLNNAQLRDPLNEDPNSYYYFYFGPDCLSYKGMAVNPNCRGHYAFMSVLESDKNDSGGTGCFIDPSHYTFWRVLGL